jgi:diguanylate cyclase
MGCDMLFAKKESKKSLDLPKWKLLISDDEQSVHEVTKLVLKNFKFKDKALDIYSAYSAKETIEIVKKIPDIDIILLDVIMESDDAGLRVVKTIRDELNNQDVRIILRTRQPGINPPKEIGFENDIDGYKEKSQLTSSD